ANRREGQEAQTEYRRLDRTPERKQPKRKKAYETRSNGTSDAPPQVVSLRRGRYALAGGSLHGCSSSIPLWWLAFSKKIRSSAWMPGRLNAVLHSQTFASGRLV